MGTPQTDTGLVYTLATGRKVPAIPQPDGTVIVRDLPLFSVIYPDDPGVKEGARQPRDRAWLEEAKRRHEVRVRQLGFDPLLTQRHIFDGPKAVGTYRLTDIRPVQVNPDEPPRDTIFHDQIFESREAFEDSKDYPWRSPEISPDDPKGFGAVALLRDKEPYGKYPNAKPELVEAYYARGGVPVAQVWAREPETFGVSAGALSFASKDAHVQHDWWKTGSGQDPLGPLAADDPAVVRALKAGTKSGKKDIDEDRAVLRRNRGGYETTPENKEAASMADAKAPEKPETMDEKMDKMASKFFETMGKKFEAMMSKYDAKDDDSDEGSETMESEDDKKPKPEASEAKPEDDKKPKTETSGARGPDAGLPPAVSQARAGETFMQIPTAQYERFVKDSAWIQKLQREREVEQFAAAGEDSIRKSGFEVTPEIKSLIKAKALKGAAAVEAFVEGFAARPAQQADPFVVYGLGGGSPTSGQEDPELKRAYEQFGQRPEARMAIDNAYRAYVQRGDFHTPFSRLVAYDERINPASHGAARGGVNLNGGR